jgi:peptidoglycan/LPS O-acetylase OafA/YrhL
MGRDHPKLVELEAVRGIAALVVLLHHTMLGFAPRLEGLFFPSERFGLFGTPIYAFVNGAAAVTLFFVLSAFVLTYRIIGAGDGAGLGIALLKRWPRLAGPVLLVSLASGLCLWAGWYANVPAAAISKSPWLGLWFGTPPYKNPPPIAAIEEGAVGAFFFARTYFNGNLWTMYYELFGSFLAFGLALAVVDLKRPRIAIPLNLVLFAIVLSWNPFFAPFVAGVLLAQAYVVHAGSLPRLRLGWLVAACLAAFLLFGFRGAVEGGRPVGFYVFLKLLPRMSPAELQVLLHSFAAVLIIGIVLSTPSFRRMLGGRLGSWLGRMSFPVYLTHLVVICSFGSHLFLWLSLRLPHAAAVLLTMGGSIAVTLAVSYPLALFDRWWVGRVNAVAALLRQGRGPEPAALAVAGAPVAAELRTDAAG